jgi:type IV secretory pathway TraG/TraD family ATPase VirD4
MLSDSRGIGVQWFPVFQSVAQILARWGEREGSAILANLNCSMVLGGLQDPKALERFSSLVGQVEMQEVSSHIDAHSNTASQRMVTESERTVLRPEEVRRLPDGVALVIYRNAQAMLVDLIPWTARPDGDEIAAGMRRVRAARIAHHRTHP